MNFLYEVVKKYKFWADFASEKAQGPAFKIELSLTRE